MMANKGLKGWQDAIRELSEEINPRYSVGETLGDGTPCIIEDGDSVVCVFPQVPESVAIDRARQVCDILNGLAA